MALIARKCLFERLYPSLEFKRFRGKINIRRPKPLHFDRAVFVELTKPWFINPKKDKKLIELCTKSTEKVTVEVENPLQQIVARELKDLFEKSRLIAFYHLNPMNNDQHFKTFVMFKKANMHFKTYGKKTMEMAVKDTKFEPILDFYISRNITVFSPEPELKKLLKISKKCPQIVLLAGIFEGKFLSRDELIQLDAIPNLQTAQANLVQTLNSAASTLTQQLNSHQNTLVSQLHEREKQLQENK